jgi:type IV secretion system protein VirB5
VFRRTVQRYGRTPEPVTPYQRAAQVWDERIGSARVQARNWRLMAFGSLLLSAGLAASSVWQSLQTRVTPYVIEVNKFGEVQAVAPAIQDYQPSDVQIAWHLGHFIEQVRGISIDPVLVRKNWLEAYDFVTDKGATFLNEYARSSDPFANIGTHSVSIQITSVVRASDASFQVKWVEQSFEHGALSATERWTALLTLVIEPPRTAEKLRKNPLGIYINGLAWSRELEPSQVQDERKAR